MGASGQGEGEEADVACGVDGVGEDGLSGRVDESERMSSAVPKTMDEYSVLFPLTYETFPFT